MLMELSGNLSFETASFDVLSNVGYCRLDSAIRLNWAEIAPPLTVGAFLKKRLKSSATLNGYSAPTHSVLPPLILPNQGALNGLSAGRVLAT